MSVKHAKNTISPETVAKNEFKDGYFSYLIKSF